MKINHLLGLSGLALAAAIAASSPASAAPVLPGQPGGDPANCGLGPGTNCLIFSDFTVFSLAYLQFQESGSDDAPKPGDTFYVASSPGALKEAIVIATGANGLTNPGGSIDNPYDTPNAVPKNTLANFGMSPTDPSPTFIGDNIQQPNTVVNNNTTPVDSAPGGMADGSLPLWDMSIAALLTYLDGGSLDFFFNLNQTKSSSDSTYLEFPQDMLGYMAVILTSADGQTSMTFRLDGNNCTGPLNGRCDPAQGVAQTANVNDILPTANDQWAYIHGRICALADGTVLNLGPCDQAMEDAGGKDIDQNLGANNASFAMYSDALNTWLNSPVFAGGTLSVDLRMAAENNGYEQLFILAGNRTTTEVPEPLTIGLFGAGLIGAGLIRRRNKKA